MRTFHLQRDEDETGISGTGVVAEGIQFTNGKVAIAWIAGVHQSTVIWDHVESVEAIHGHGGKTRVVWHDSPTEEVRAFVEYMQATARNVAVRYGL